MADSKAPVVTGVHPVAALFPMLDEHDMKVLAADIATNGLQQSLVVDAEGLLIDGRNRLAACEVAKVEPTFTTLNGDVDPVLFILSSNTMRRQMTKSQIAMVAAYAEANQERHDALLPYGWKKAAAARVAGLVSSEMVSRAGFVLEWAPDLAAGVLAGTEHFTEVLTEARSRRNYSQSAETRQGVLALEAPQLAAAVEEESLTLDEAWRTHKERQRQHEAAVERTTDSIDTKMRFWLGYVDEDGKPGEAGKVNLANLAEMYDPERAGVPSAITKTDIQSVILVLRELKKGWWS